MEKTLAQKAALKVPEWSCYANSRKVTQNPHFLKKCKGASQGKFFKNRPKSSLPLKGPKALCRKWHYPQTSMLLRCKDWRRFWRRRRLKKCPNGEVMAIFARSPKTRVFIKSAKGDQGKFLKNGTKSGPCLKGLKELWRKWHFPLISMHL